MKKILAIIIVIVVAVSLTACSSGYTNAERFAARANVTLNRGIHDFNDLKDADTFVFTTIEYYEADGARVIRAVCTVHIKTNDSYERFVFVLSDKEDYLNNLIDSLDGWYERPKHLEETELYFVNLADFEFTVNEDNTVSIANVSDLKNKYFDSRDKSIIGMK